MDRNIPKPPEPEEGEKRIALLYLKTGGGHLSAAKALSQALENSGPPRTRSYLFDPVPEDAPFAQAILQDGYRFTSHKVGKLWILLYEFSKLKAVDIIWSFSVFLTVRKNLTAFIEENRIDTVVFLHFLLSRPLKWVLRKLGRKPKLLRIVTDPFTAHNMWFNRPEIPTVVFSERLKNSASIRYPDIADSLLLFPPVLGKTFNPPPGKGPREEVRKRFGISPGENVILFAGGGEGFPKGIRYIRELLRQNRPDRIFLVCGKDGALKERAENLSRQYPDASFTALGFIDYMADLMRVSDIVVTKGGPATIMEALSCGKPVIVIQYLYGQERGNMEYVVHNSFGYYASSPKGMVRAIEKLTDDDGVYRRIREKIRLNPPENGTGAIARYIETL